MILLTGHRGYIGGHVAHHLKNRGFEFEGIDLVDGFDCREYRDIEYVFYGVETVMHFAAFKSIPESLIDPVEYLHNNIVSTANVLRAMKKYGCKKIIFSSSCSVYGNQPSPIREDAPLNPETPYALSKKICEEMIIASGINYSILRYFNPIGEYYGIKDKSTDGIQHNMRSGKFVIFGGDYPTEDGTPARDFIDIKELADAHILAIKWDNEIVNIGTGKPKTVKMLAEEMGVTYTIGERRIGDVAAIWANVEKYRSLL